MANRGEASTSGNQSNNSGCLPCASLGIFLALKGIYAGVRLQLLLKAKEDPKKSLGGHTGKKGIDSYMLYVV
jgi:hypothetical protein